MTRKHAARNAARNAQQYAQHLLYDIHTLWLFVKRAGRSKEEKGRIGFPKQCQRNQHTLIKQRYIFHKRGSRKQLSVPVYCDILRDLGGLENVCYKPKVFLLSVEIYLALLFSVKMSRSLLFFSLSFVLCFLHAKLLPAYIIVSSSFSTLYHFAILIVHTCIVYSHMRKISLLLLALLGLAIGMQSATSPPHSRSFIYSQFIYLLVLI